MPAENASGDSNEVGFVVDAGPGIGYGHVVRCLRVARRLADSASPVFYPLSAACGRFLAGRGFPVRSDASFPALTVSDLCCEHPLLAAIAARGSRHISVRDLGLAQCDADVVIDGSITQVNPYPARAGQRTFVGPEYMVIETRDAARQPRRGVAFVTLGGGVSAEYAPALAAALADAGYEVYATRGFGAGSRDDRPRSPGVLWVSGEDQIAGAVSRADLAITTSGVSLYEMLAAGVPTIALSVDDYQQATADAFHGLGAVEAMGRIGQVEPCQVVDRANRLSGDRSLMSRLTETGRRLVDGKGLIRVTEIVRGELCPTV